jgi:hypothetical protein
MSSTRTPADAALEARTHLPAGATYAELDGLRTRYEAASHASALVDGDDDALDAAAQEAWDAWVDAVESAGLNETEHDPRGPRDLELDRVQALSEQPVRITFSEALAVTLARGR